ncbi:MAG: nucleotide-diphospho-sugar transferase [Candidatus Magasanikbacteria bacterium]|nr:nucleotide-diphospho-sugar transferase [Candidatus Magasanikbacteria bacterium]
MLSFSENNGLFPTPILLVIFNRPEKLKNLMKILSQVKPEKLYISADGPRKNNLKDVEFCKRARNIATNINWPCEIYTNFATENLGLSGNRGLETAFNWFFSIEPEGIIFEDDHLPSLDYFNYAQTLLSKYRDEEKVMMICGTNFQGEIEGDGASYYFSIYPTWGWATWRRSWDKYDREMKGLDSFLNLKKIDEILYNLKQKKYWINFFKKIKNGKFHFMDSKLMFAMWNSNSVCIIPNSNLIENIGFGEGATNTFDEYGLSMVRRGLKEINHPKTITVNRTADDFFYNKVCKRSLFQKIKYKIKFLFREL